MNGVSRDDKHLSRRHFLALAAGGAAIRCAGQKGSPPVTARTPDTTVPSAQVTTDAGYEPLSPVSSATSASTEATGEVTEVTLAPGHQGILFEPTGFDPSTPRPVILLFDPVGNAAGIVSRYAKAARQHRWLVASPFGVANGTPDDIDLNVMMLLLDYVRSRHAVDATRIFTGGFSGGACAAYRLAIVKSDVFSGAIVECGHMGSWREVGEMAARSLRFYLFTRGGDFNRPATRRLRDAMLAKGCRVTEVEGLGIHAPMFDAEVSEAMDWMEAPQPP
jgi:predicted esterase